jgi:magnesium transporter
VAEISNKIEERLQEHEDKLILNDIENQKRKLIQLRTISRPLRDITEQLNGSETQLIDKDNLRYFKSLDNHCKNLVSEIDSQIQILDGLANFYYAAQGQRMNEIMKVLTIVSAIFIPLTFIVGIYGMNFEHMPELKMKYGYATVLIVMAISAILMFLYFVKKGWLKKSDYHLDNE